MNAQGAPLFYFVEKAGPHSVGLKAVEQYDYSRIYRHLTDELGKPYQGERARPLQTLVWYPAEPSHGKPMTVGDYANLWTTETSFDKPKMPAHAMEWLSAMSLTLAKPLWAVRDATPASGKFPVIVYAPSFSSMSWENADLCEYLASHGYVVLASPNMGATTRAMTADLAGINAQARDISFLIGYAQTLPNTDMPQVAVAGFSWGGISNLFAAARDNRIRALVAFDGSLRYWPGLVKQAGDVHPQAMAIPLLYFAQAGWTLEEQAQLLSGAQNDGPNVLNAWIHGDLVTVRMLGMTHRQFSSMFQRNEDLWKEFHDREFGDRQKADYGRKYGIPAYGWVARYTLQFLDAYLKREAAAMDFLKKASAEHGVPKHFLVADYRAAQGAPAAFEAFRAEIGRQGFDRAIDIQTAMQKERADFKLDEGALNAWAEELIDGDHLREAVVLLELNAKTYPDSSGAYASLGRAYRRSGQRSLAVQAYRQAVEKNRFNAEARRNLQDLASV